MNVKAKRRTPEFVIRNGEPSGVILDIDEYEEMLERLEDIEDLAELQAMRKKPLKFKKLESIIH
jgi:PHD/YefM family antitoxin component YafN of YafNO toxin-antitoxin module